MRAPPVGAECGRERDIAVRHYRIYGLGSGGRFVSVHEVERDTDDQALAEARNLMPAGEFELWEHGRFVARVHPGGRPVPPPAA
jgi:hypothetical protein